MKEIDKKNYMEEDEWRELLQKIKQGDCILMLGPEIPIIANVEKQSKSLTEMLCEELRKKLVKILKQNNPNNNPADDIEDCKNINELATKYGKKERPALVVQIKDFLKAKNTINSSIHKMLSALPFKFIINTTFDDILYNCYKEEGKNPSKDFYNFRPKFGDNKDILLLRKTSRTLSNSNQTDLGSVGQPFIYYLYGDLSKPHSLVISENDMIDSLVTVIKNEPDIHGEVKTQLSKDKKCFLFLGFNFLRNNWYFRILLHMLNAHDIEGYSFAIDDVDATNECGSNPIIFYKSQFKIKFIEKNLITFIKDLYEKYIQSESKKIKVFISYSNSDREFAEALTEFFYEMDIIPWRDKKNLRCGDDWYHKIEDVLNNEVDAFVVIHSRAVEDDLKCLVREEIGFALRRKDKNNNVNFIFPITIDEGVEPLHALKDLHHEILNKEGNLKKLVEDIKFSVNKFKNQFH